MQQVVGMLSVASPRESKEATGEESSKDAASKEETPKLTEEEKAQKEVAAVLHSTCTWKMLAPAL